MRILIVAVVASVGLIGCTGAKNYSPNEIANLVKIESSEFDDKATIVGPKIQTTHSEGLLSIYHNDFRLRGWKSKNSNQPTSFQLYIQVEYVRGSWAFFQSASFVGGKTVDLTKIKRDVSSCSSGSGCIYSEIVGLEVKVPFLEKQKSSGFRVRLNSKSGATTVLEVPANYIQGYLSAFARAK